MFTEHAGGRLDGALGWHGDMDGVRLLTVLAGQVRLESATLRDHLQAGDTVLLMPDRPVTCTAVGGVRLVMGDAPARRILHGRMVRTAPFMIARRSAAVPAASAAYLIELFAHDVEELPVTQRIALACLVMSAMTAAVDAVHAEGHQEAGPQAQMRAMVRRYIASRCTSANLSARSIAQVMSVSPRTLQRLFEGHRSVNDEIEVARVRHAIARIQDSDALDLPLSEVARLSGFTSTTTLRRAVQRATGSRPSELRSHLIDDLSPWRQA